MLWAIETARWHQYIQIFRHQLIVISVQWWCVRVLRVRNTQTHAGIGDVIYSKLIRANQSRLCTDLQITRDWWELVSRERKSENELFDLWLNNELASIKGLKDIKNIESQYCTARLGNVKCKIYSRGKRFASWLKLYLNTYQ